MPFVVPDDLKTIEVDYLIVGGGTAGLALAARLSEDSGITVLVVEAGSYHGPTPKIDVPGFIGSTIASPDFDWTFSSVHQKGANGRVILQSSGKGLGGSSLINFLAMSRPSKEESDALATLGNEGWDWNNLLQYMKRSETISPISLSEADAITYAVKPDPAFHGTDGPIKKSLSKVWTTVHAKLFDAADALGVPRNPEPYNGRNIGSMTPFFSLDPSTGKRSYAASGFLDPNIKRKNLLVMTDAYVSKVLMEVDSSLSTAVGVEVIWNGKTTSIAGIKRDVIISAGTFQTPKVLELSGIGNWEILATHEIKCAIDLPEDHVGVSTIVEIQTDDETVDVLTDPIMLQKHEDLYKDHRTGLFSSVPAPVFIFVPASALGTDEDIASWQKQMVAQSTEAVANAIPSLRTGLEKQYAILHDLLASNEQAQAEILMFNGHQLNQGVAPERGKRYTSLVCALMHPLSRGTVHIASVDPLVPPLINPNYFAIEADLDLFVRIVQFALKLYSTPPFNACVRGPVIPNEETIAKGEEGLREYVKEKSRTTYHPVGTAAMLPREDGGVVDSNLRVYGTSNLRIVDNSVIPLLSCHTQSVAYAIGEKAAYILKSEYS